MNILKKWIDGLRSKEKLQKSNRIKEEFQVVDRDGKLWFTHMGYAFREIEAKKTASDIAKELEEIRNSAIRYEGLIQNPINPKDESHVAR